MPVRRALLYLSDPAICSAIAERLRLDGIAVVVAEHGSDPGSVVDRAATEHGLDILITDLT